MRKIKLTISIVVAAVLWSCSSEMPASVDSLKNETGAQEVMISVFDEGDEVTVESASLVADVLTGRNSAQSRAFGENGVVSEIKGSDGSTAMYVVNYGENDGFVIVSADKGYGPVLAHSETGHFDVDAIGESGVSVWVEETKAAIAHCSELPDSVKGEIASRWRELTTREVPLSTLSRSTTDTDPWSVREAAIQTWQSQGYTVYSVSSANLSSFPAAIQSAANRLNSMPQGEYNVSQKDLSVILVKSVSESEFISRWVNTQWHQEWPYNAAINDINNVNNLGNKLGCVPIAIGQILKYHKKPTEYDFENMPNLLKNVPNPDLTLPNFLREIGEKCGINYESGSSGSVMFSMIKTVFNSLNYNCKESNFNRDEIITSLNNYGPLILASDSSNGIESHCWVLDGYKVTEYGTEYILKAYVGDFGDVNPTAAYHTSAAASVSSGSPSTYFHMIWGWNKGDGWFGTNAGWTAPNGGRYDSSVAAVLDIHYKYD